LPVCDSSVPRHHSCRDLLFWLVGVWWLLCYLYNTRQKKRCLSSTYCTNQWLVRPSPSGFVNCWIHKIRCSGKNLLQRIYFKISERVVDIPVFYLVYLRIVSSRPVLHFSKEVLCCTRRLGFFPPHYYQSSQHQTLEHMQPRRGC
jgi:hypothetical protein